MCDRQEKPPQRFGDHYWDVLAALDEVTQAARESREETFLDARGQKRRFLVQVHGGGTLTFLSAWEQRPDGEPGMRLLERFDEGCEVPPYARLRDRVRERLATRDLARDPDSGALQLLTGSIRAQLTTDPDAPDDLPAVLIDDELLSWDDLGRLLSTYEGFGLRIRVMDE
jgi:hypothetical protein